MAPTLRTGESGFLRTLGGLLLCGSGSWASTEGKVTVNSMWSKRNEIMY